MEYNSFELTVENHVAHLALNIPKKRNALDIDAWQEMRSIFDSLSTNSDVRVVVLSGNGKHFCAGIDLMSLMSVQQTDETCEAKKREKIREMILILQDSITSIERCRKPVIAAIHNGCIGGGIDLVSACDMRYCTEEAFFTIKETDLGLVADIGTMQRLPTILNPGRVAEMAYTARNVGGPEAKSIGLVNEVYATKESMMKEVNLLAEVIASKSPLVIRGVKEALLYKRDHSVEDGLKQAAIYNAAMIISEDLVESFQAHLEKRKPEYRD